MPITVEQIKQRTNNKTYKLGLEIYRDPSKPIIEPAIQGDRLIGYYQGSSLDPYHIEVTLDEDTIIATDCTCGYKRHDDCKHVVALLISYLHEPDLFARLSEVTDPLLELGRDELLHLVRRMVVRYPDLQALIDEPDQEWDVAQDIDVERYRHEMHEVLHHDRRNRYAADAVYDMVETAQYYATQEFWRAACQILIAVLEESLSPNHTAFDEEGKLVHALSMVVDELIANLGHRSINEDRTQRQQILLALLDAYVWETQTRWEGLTEQIPETILAYAHQDDLSLLKDRIRPLRQQALDDGKLQIAGTYSNFLTYVETLADNPDVIIRYLGEQGLYELQFHKYILLDRVEDATQVIRHHLQDPDQHLDAVNILYEAGHTQTALKLTEAAIKHQFNSLLAGWLIDKYRLADHYPAAFRLQRQLMAHAPTLGNYIQLKELGRILGLWEETRQRILDWLRETGNHEVLTEIYLDEYEWQEAWDSWEAATLSDWRRRDLEFEVAEQSRFAMPERAIPVYLARVRANIEAKKRQNYRVAVELLHDVHKLYQLQDDLEDWQATLESFREEYKRLSALQDELEKAGW